MTNRVQFTKVRGLHGENLVVVVNGEMETLDDQHPNYREILAACERDDDREVTRLINVAKSLKETFEPITERVRIADNQVFFDGDIADNAITEAMVRYHRDGEEDDLLALANFFEKLSTNPSGISRTQLYRWLQTHDFTLLDDGDILAYKGMKAADEKGVYHSIHAGVAMVDGKVVNGHIPNPIGSLIEMPRSEVNEDPNVACAQGLHVGTWEFAKSFGRGPVLAIAVNPRDIVSVPKDANNQKVRTCRYRVLELVSRQDARLSRATTSYNKTGEYEQAPKKIKSWMDKVNQR